MAKLPSEQHKGSESYVYHAVPTTTAARIRSTRARRTTTEKFTFTFPTYYDTTRKAEAKSTVPRTTTRVATSTSKIHHSSTTEDWGWMTYSYSYYTTTATTIAQHERTPHATESRVVAADTTRSIGAKITDSRVVASDGASTSRSNADKTTS